MTKVNTRNRIKLAALPLFAEQGYAGTSIANIEAAADLAPRAGAFYRHFSSKQELFEEIAREQITETPDEFDIKGLSAYDNTRVELISMARQFEIASERQRPYLRLIEEFRLTSDGQAFEKEANESMLHALMEWVATKPAGDGLEPQHLAALTISVFGGWLFFLTKSQQGLSISPVEQESLLSDWAKLWAGVLDRRR